MKPKQQTKTIKVPEHLTRAAQVTITGEGEARAFSMSISSTEPYKRYDWWNDEEYYEVLNHKDLDETRLKKGLPILFNHNRDQHLGRATEYTNDGKKITVSGIIWSESELAKTKKADALSGALPDTSVGYRLLDEGTCIGAKDGIPIYEFRFEPYEGSLVTVPADVTVGVGRDMPKEELIKLRSLPSREIAIQLQKGIDVTPVNGNKRNMEPEVIEVSPAQEKGILAKERKRQSEITALCGHFKEKGLGGTPIDASECAQTCISEGKSLAEFQDLVVRGAFKPVQAVVSSPLVARDEKEMTTILSKYSVVRAMRCLARRNGVLDGFEKEMSDEAEKIAKRSGAEMAEGAGFFIPHDVMRAPRLDGTNGRALVTNVFSAAGALVGSEVLGGSMIELLRNKMFTAAMGARTLGGLTSNIQIPAQTGGATATWLSEAATISESLQAVGQVGLTPHRLAALTAFTTQLIAQSSVDVESFVREDLMRVLAIARDLAAIAGTGNNGQPLGILSTSGLSTSVTFAGAQTMLYADALAFENNVALNNADLGSLGYMVTPTVRKNAKATAEISAANSNPIWKNDMVNGYAAKATNQVPTATSVIFGNWADLILAEWAANQVIVDPYSLAQLSQVRIVMHQLCDNALRHAKSFSVSTN